MWFLYVLLVLIVLFGLYVFMIFPRPKHFRPKSEVFDYTSDFAHRGLFDNNLVAENSLTAFKAAIKLGCGIEFDVQLSKDGIPVIMHDYSLVRMCGVEKKVSDLNIDELKQLKLLDTEDTIPTLREALELIDGKVPLIIEMKTESTDIAVCPQSEILLRHYSGAYCVESFNPLAVRWYKIHRPEIIRGQLSSAFFKDKKARHDVLTFAIGQLITNFLARPDFIAFDRRFADSKPFRLCTGLLEAIPVSWTVTEKEQMKEEPYEIYIFEGFIPDERKKNI